VILGAIGPENQRDFKVIGDSVNVSARLCSVAKGNEIVVYAKLGDDAFGPLGTIQVKGPNTHWRSGVGNLIKCHHQFQTD
jgi:adenylate cyclase